MVGEASNIACYWFNSHGYISSLRIAGSATSGGSNLRISTSTDRTIATAGVGGLVSSIATLITGALL